MATYTTVEEQKKKLSAAPSAGAAYDDYDGQYHQAMDRVAYARQNMPTYDATYDQAVQDMFQDVMNYEKFSYNTRDDMLFQAYKQSYSAAGKRAMEDSMGQASALTGGYGSSYSQTVGEQQYAEYLQKLNDVLPETYAMAYQQYRDEKDALQQRYDMTGQLAEDEYQKYQNRLSSYYQELGYWQDVADTAYNRKQYADQQAYDREQDAYEKQQDAYERLADMIVNTGYIPDADDLAAAGMKDREYQAYLNYFNSMNASSSGGGGSSRSKKKKSENSSRYDEMLAEQKKLIDKGKSVEVINGGLSEHAVSNGLSVEETRKIMEELTNYAVAKKKGLS